MRGQARPAAIFILLVQGAGGLTLSLQAPRVPPSIHHRRIRRDCSFLFATKFIGVISLLSLFINVPGGLNVLSTHGQAHAWQGWSPGCLLPAQGRGSFPHTPAALSCPESCSDCLPHLACCVRGAYGSPSHRSPWWLLPIATGGEVSGRWPSASTPSERLGACSAPHPHLPCQSPASP